MFYNLYQKDLTYGGKMKRDRSIDLMKFVLVIGMILAHVIQFFGENTYITTFISNYVNMITFSGFLFCFGYVCNIVYLKKDKKSISKNLMRNSIKLLMAFYVSGICYRIFVSVEPFSVVTFLKILVLEDIPGYSEFLISFALLNIGTYMFFNQIKYILNSKYFILFLIVPLLCTNIPYHLVNENQVGLLIGTTKFPCFPVVQYSIFYFLGMYFQKNKIDFKFKHLILSVFASSILVLYCLKFNQLPSRFPPSLPWILGPMLYLNIYYSTSKLIVKRYEIYNWINFIGENTLFFLLSSNIIIFIVKFFVQDVKFTLISCIIFSILITISAYIALNLTKIYSIANILNLRKVRNET